MEDITSQLTTTLALGTIVAILLAYPGDINVCNALRIPHAP